MTAAHVTAKLGEQGLRISQRLRRFPGREAAATQGLRTKSHVQVSRCYPAQLHAIIGILLAQHGPVYQGCITKVPGMRMKPVEVAHIGIESTKAQPGTGRHGQRIHKGLLNLDLGTITVIVQADRGLPKEQLVDGGRQNQLGFIQR